MSRRVITAAPVLRSAGGKPGSNEKTVQQADDFLGRLVKYIPAEIVGLFVAVRGIVPQNAPTSVLWLVGGISWALVPIYFWISTTRGNQKPMVRQIIFATVAFPVWVFAIGGNPAASWGWYRTHSYVGSILLIFLTVIFGWIEPVPGS